MMPSYGDIRMSVTPKRGPGQIVYSLYVTRKLFASNRVRLGNVALLLCLSSLHAQQNNPPEHTCSCPDGRQFAVGASMYGKSSSRILITGLRPDLPRGANGELPPCTDVLVVGQAIQLLTGIDGRPYLRRDTLKRGAIRDVCRTEIHFIKAQKSYDFFADDGSAVTLSDNDVGQPSGPNSAHVIDNPEIGSSEDLTGKDLLQLMPRLGASSPFSRTRPGDSRFDEADLKEGAYFIVRKRSKASVITNQGAAVAHSAAATPPMDVSVNAGTLGRIEKRAGTQSEPLWVVELLPDSVPRPFLKSLMHPVGVTRAPLTNVVLASSQIAEINDFLDRYRVEWTRFGEAQQSRAEPDSQSMRLPLIYVRPKLSLDENLAAARRTRSLDSIQAAALGLVLVPKESQTLARRGTLILDESVTGSRVSRKSIAPDLLRQQCFVGLDHLSDSAQEPPELSVTHVDVRTFHPKDSAQVPQDYYAIDLQLQLQPNFSSGPVPLVCRFPSGPIDVGLVDLAERILSSRFEIRRRP
jgi:hypothetical protein